MVLPVAKNTPPEGGGAFRLLIVSLLSTQALAQEEMLEAI
jgi:hypothetical protein